jgi:hypothetical protein
MDSTQLVNRVGQASAWTTTRALPHEDVSFFELLWVLSEPDEGREKRAAMPRKPSSTGLPLVGHHDVFVGNLVAVLSVEALSGCTFMGYEVDRVYAVVPKVFFEMIDEPAAHARPLRIRPYAEGFQIEDLPHIIWLSPTGRERYDPLIEGDQAHEPRHPHGPGHFLLRRVECPVIAPRLGVEGGY